MIIPTQELLAYFFVFTRASALLSMIPSFSGRIIPTKVQLALGFGISLLIATSVSEDRYIPENFLGIMLAVGNELLVGLLMGFAVRIFFYIAEFAGSIISTEAGLTRSDVFDPMTETQSSPVSNMLFYLCTILIFATGMHYDILRTFVVSYKSVPLGGSLRFLKGAESFVKASGDIFLIGVKIAAPILAMNFVLNMTFSVLGKAVPKMNVFMVSFAVRILAGFALLFMAIGLIVQYLGSSLQVIPRRMIEFLIF